MRDNRSVGFILGDVIEIAIVSECASEHVIVFRDGEGEGGDGNTTDWQIW